MGNVTIKFENVQMKFHLYRHKIDSIKDYFIAMFKKSIVYQDFYALSDVNIEILHGERIGLIGPNGSGKSTFLKLISKVMEPTEGIIEVNGQVAPLLELGAGFDFEFSGYDNIYLNAAILGKDEKFIKEHYNEIVEFSELEDFIDVPVKNYSSGMRAKLGFSIATLVDPDILLLDEVLGVGDEAFREKSHTRMKEMINTGNTVVVASHRIEMIRELTEKTIWLDHGKIRMFDETNKVCDEYLKANKWKNT